MPVEACKNQQEWDQYRQIFELAPVGLLVIDPNENITMVNPVMAKKLGVAPQAVIGRQLYTCIHVASRLILRNNLTQGGAASDEGVLVEWQQEEGGTLVCRLKARMLIAGDGPLRGTLISIEDMSGAQKERDDLLQVLGRMRLESTAKSRFLATVSHEIRSPLNAIIGMTDLVLMTGTLEEAHRIALNHGKASARRLCRIIKDLMDFSKIEAGQLEIIKGDFDLHTLCQEVFASLHSAVEEKGLTLQMQVDAAIPRLLTSDSCRVYQVLVNLLGNAFKFTSQGFVALAVTLKGEDASGIKVQFEVSDSGPGIPSDKLELIFDEYRQVSSNMFCRSQGIGLGLAISRSLVENMGGRLEVVSEVGKGSRFFFTLPFGVPAAAEPALRKNGA